MKTYSWLIRRELWEFRATWIIPAAIGVVMVVATLFGRVDVSAFDSPLATMNMGSMFLVALAALFYTVMSIYSAWYLMDCLYNDRRDRSILFWKSLPVSDTQTVLSKLVMGLVVIPLVFLIASDLTSLLMAFVLSVRARAVFAGVLWHPGTWFQVQVLWLYVLVTTAIWYLPVAGWLMMVSAWAKRAVMLWTVLPLLVVYLIETFFLHTHVVHDVIGRRLAGYAAVAYHGNEQWISQNLSDTSTSPVSVWRFVDASGFFSSLEVWIGLVVGIAMIIAAIQLRLRRSEI
jgi:ABC-2 type transport system permease protein